MFNWSGFYAGGNIGYGWGHASSRFPDDFTFAPPGAPNPLGFPSHGLLGGGGFGYNWLLARNWVGGIEVDFNAANLRGSADYNVRVSPFSVAVGTAVFKTDFFGTARVRFGYAVNNVL
jgi:outer membrane immunogenic protein